MSDKLRRMYNKVDMLFDTRAISQEIRFSRSGGKSVHPITALQAFKIIQPIVFEFDRQAQLKLIVSQQGIQADGASSHWEFFLDLTARRAKLMCDWILPWVELKDAHAAAGIQVLIKPFPSVDSPLRRLVEEGKLLHRQLAGMWEQERHRTPNLPFKFRDTDKVATDLKQKGLDIGLVEFSLTTGRSPQGQLCWIAQTRKGSYYAAFT